MCGLEISSSQVSRAATELDTILKQWRERPLGSIRYLILDARYEKVRQQGAMRSCAVLIALEDLGRSLRPSRSPANHRTNSTESSEEPKTITDASK
jgi:hypothetical protein